MNDEREKLGETLHRIANALLKYSGFAIRYKPEIILIGNKFRNRESVLSRNNTSFEAETRRPSFLSHLQRIRER